MSSPEGTPEASRLAKLELNARLYHYDKRLDEAADLFDSDVAAWSRLPLIVQDRSGIYRDARAAYRAAVEAGAIAPDPHTPAA